MEMTKQQFKAAKILFAVNMVSAVSVNVEPVCSCRRRIENTIKELDKQFKQLKKEHEENSN